MFLMLMLEVCSPTASMKSMMVGSIDDELILLVLDMGKGRLLSVVCGVVSVVLLFGNRVSVL